MRERALIHVAGPKGAGKTTFIEALLRDAPAPFLAARCIRDDSLARMEESVPEDHAELRRYRQARAAGTSLLVFPGSDVGTDEFFLTGLMEGYSEAVVLEGDNPVGFVDVHVFVAPSPAAGQTLFVKRARDRAAARAARSAMESTLRDPDRSPELLEALLEMAGAGFAEFARERPEILEKARKGMLEELEAEGETSPAPTERWAISEGYEGIEHAGLVVVNVRTDAERERGEQLVEEVRRLRRDDELFDDILGFRGSKVQVTAVTANLADPEDPGRKKALARVRRVLPEASG